MIHISCSSQRTKKKNMGKHQNTTDWNWDEEIMNKQTATQIEKKNRNKKYHAHKQFGILQPKKSEARVHGF